MVRRLRRAILGSLLLVVALLAQFAGSLSPAPVASAHAGIAPTGCDGGGVYDVQPPIISIPNTTARLAGHGGVASIPASFDFYPHYPSGNYVDSFEYRVYDGFDAAGTLLYDSGAVTPPIGIGDECTYPVTISAYTGWVQGGSYSLSLRLHWRDGSGNDAGYQAVVTSNFTIATTALPTATAVPPTATITPTPPACVSFGGSDPVWQYPVGIQTSLTPDGRFYYQSSAARNMNGYDWYVLDAQGNIIYHKGFQTLTLSPGCSVSITVPANILQYGQNYCLQAITKDSASTNSALVKDCFSVIQGFGSGSGNFVPGGGSSSANVSPNISYACGTPPLIDNSDNRGGMPVIISWIWCQVQHFDMLAPFEGLIDPFIGNLFGWFRNWNGFFGPAWSDLNNLAGAIPNLWNNISGVKSGITSAINTLLQPIKDIGHSITDWFYPHPTDFIPFQSVLADLGSKEPIHFILYTVNQYIDISNQFWTAAGLHTADLPAVVSSSSSLGCNALPADVPSATATATSTIAATPTDVPVWPTPTYNAPPIWPTPPWGYVAPGRGVSYLVTPVPTYAGWNGVACSAVVTNQIPSDTGASSGGVLPSVPSIIPQVATGGGGYADAYVNNPLSGNAAASASYGPLAGGLSMFIDLLAHMGISRDNFAKIIDLFVIVAAIAVIGRDLGVGIGDARRIFDK